MTSKLSPEPFFPRIADVSGGIDCLLATRVFLKLEKNFTWNFVCCCVRYVLREEECLQLCEQRAEKLIKENIYWSIFIRLFIKMSIPTDKQDSSVQEVECGCVMQLNDSFISFDLLHFIWSY